MIALEQFLISSRLFTTFEQAMLHVSHVAFLPPHMNILSTFQRHRNMTFQKVPGTSLDDCHDESTSMQEALQNMLSAVKQTNGESIISESLISSYAYFTLYLLSTR